MRGSCRLGLLLVMASVAAPAAGEQIVWSHDVEASWEQAVSQRRPLLLLITRSRCKYCVQLKTTTLADARVADQVMGEFVPVAIDPGNSPDLIKELNVKSFPTTLIISPDAVMLEQIKGYLPPAEFQRRLSRCRGLEAAARQPRSSRR